MLDELSAQGLRLWQDQGQRWCWAWAETALHSERGFWAIGEAIVDAVVTRFPAAFDMQEWDERRAVEEGSEEPSRRASKSGTSALLLGMQAREAQRFS